MHERRPRLYRWFGPWILVTLGVLGTPVHAKVLDPENLDASVDARQDFYRYANGGWLKRTVIPAAYGRWGAFESLDAEVHEQLRAIAEAALGEQGAVSEVTQKVADFYRSGMDEARIAAAGAAALTPARERIATVHDVTSLAACVGYLHSLGIDALFGFGASQDAKNSQRVIAQLVQGGLGLPNRDYYTDPDKRALRDAYVTHVAASLALLGTGVDEAKVAAAKIMALETALAQASLTAVERRDPNRTYNIRHVSQLQEGAQPFAWSVYLDALGLGDPGVINVENPDFAAAVGALAHTQPSDAWQAYLTWNLVRSMSPYLSDAFVDEHFQFFGKTLQGAQALQPRYKRVLSSADSLIGEAVGQLYVAKYFPPAAKERAAALVEGLRGVLRQMIAELPWMGAATRAKAQEKLDRLGVKIGYPETWIDYHALDIRPDAYAGNILRAQQFGVARDLARINKPTDRKRWDMTPQTVNAYYDPSMNEIVFPAAILQYPFFDPKADDAFNYGGIGAVIGHEMTHGYDDQGRQYDADGNLNDWWTAEDAAQFVSRAARIVSQFDHYQMFGKNVNGALTQGENIADLGGIKIAYRALQETLAKTGRPAAIDGFTPEQRFFLAFAQVWRNQVRRETALARLVTDPHSPGEWRVNGPLSNLPEFYAAFGVRPNDAMYRSEAERVTIW